MMKYLINFFLLNRPACQPGGTARTLLARPSRLPHTCRGLGTEEGQKLVGWGRKFIFCRTAESEMHCFSALWKRVFLRGGEKDVLDIGVPVNVRARSSSLGVEVATVADMMHVENGVSRV